MFPGALSLGTRKPGAGRLLADEPPAALQPEHTDPVRSASGTQRPSQEPSVVSPWLGAHTGAQRLRLSCHRCVTSSEAVVEVAQRAYQVREGQQAAGQVGRGSGGRAHPHPVYPPGLGKAAEVMDAQGGHLLDPSAQTGSALWAGRRRAHTRAAGSLSRMTPQDSPRTQRVPWDPRSAALNSESLWKSLKVLCVREVGGADRTPGCVARGSEWADWGCPPRQGTSAEHVSLAASISLWTWMPPLLHFLKYQGSKHVAGGDICTPSTELLTCAP